jgi:hypothetical protein
MSRIICEPLKFGHFLVRVPIARAGGISSIAINSDSVRLDVYRRLGSNLFKLGKVIAIAKVNSSNNNSVNKVLHFAVMYCTQLVIFSKISE